MGAGKAANAAKPYIHINTYALNMHISCVYFNIVSYTFPRNPILEDQLLEECWGLLLEVFLSIQIEIRAKPQYRRVHSSNGDPAHQTS